MTLTYLKITAASLYEEKRCGYLKQQMTRLLSIRERRRSKNIKTAKSQGNQVMKHTENFRGDNADCPTSEFFSCVDQGCLQGAER